MAGMWCMGTVGIWERKVGGGEGEGGGEGWRIGSNVTGGSRKSPTNTGVVGNTLFASCL